MVSEDYNSNEYHRPATPGPPPSYDAVVVPLTTKDTAIIDLTKQQQQQTDDTGLPTYETAVQQLRITQNGYV